MRFLLLSRDGDHPIGAELSRMGHEVVVASGPEVTAATVSLVDVLVVGAAQVREKSEWFNRLRAQIRAAEVSVLGMAESLAEEELAPLMEIGVDDYLVSPYHPADVRARIALFERRCYAFMRRQSHEESARGEIERLAAIIQTQNDIALAGLDLDVVMRLIAERAMILCGAGGAAVGIIEGEEMYYRVCTGYSKQFEGARLAIASTMAGTSVLRGEVMRTDDTERDPRANVDAARRLKVRSMLNVPLKRDNQTVGVLSIVSQVPFAFVDSDERTLELMAGLLGAAMGNAAEHAAKQALMTEVASIVTALQETQHLFDSFLNNNPALAYMKDDAGRRIFANEPFRRFFGLSPGVDVSTIPDEQLMPPETVAHLHEQDEQAFKTGQPSVTESTIPTPDGEPRQFLTYRFIARDSSGRRFLGGVSFDITERKAAEEALRRSEESFRALIEGSPEAIFVHRGGPLLYVNPSACSFLHLKGNELVGRSLLDFVLPEDRAEAASMLEGLPGRGLMPGGHRVREIRFQPPDGGVLTAEISSLRLVFAGQPATLVSARDLTERRQIQARLVVADRLASVGTLAAGVAHEINNPLAFVISNLSFLTEELQAIAEQLPEGRLSEINEVLQETNEGVNRVRLIVQDLKTFSRGDEEQPTAVDLRRVIDSALALARGELRHRATVVKEVAEVPLVEGSEARFGQVVLNLLINAAHAISAGQPDKNEIRVCLRAESDHAIIEVRDTGCGMAPEVLGRIFDPFFTTKPVGVGTGLGLSICHGIITGFGGEITASSEQGKGSTFRISLPSIRKNRMKLGA
ncbi:ATP-binding protein [Archangium sp.]|uniref:ATP-binding protein n=1 Tax=Archangium sp. TaxID=1872627 RepID=UPI00389B1FF5